MNQLIVGDVREMLRDLPAGSVHTCVTSPPYFGLRDYGVDGQIGLEQTPDEYVAELVEVFREVRRVLRDDGTLWLNIGDSYAAARGGTHQPAETLGGGKGGKTADGERVNRSRYDGYDPTRNAVAIGLKHKDLIGIPWRVAFALQADGWYLRQDIIWHKPNPMPESVKDRCTKAHEYIFLLTKQPKYFFDHEAMKEDAVYSGNQKTQKKGSFEGKRKGQDESRIAAPFRHVSAKRNRRSVWTVTTKPFKEAHFAVYPPDLIEPCIKAGCPEQCCSECGKPFAPTYEKTQEEDPSLKGSAFDKGKTGARTGGDRTQTGGRFIKRFVGYSPNCKCNATISTGVVLDPFFGAGTTGLVAQNLKRNWIGVELNPEYAEIARKRLGVDTAKVAHNLLLWALVA